MLVLRTPVDSELSATEQQTYLAEQLRSPARRTQLDQQVHTHHQVHKTYGGPDSAEVVKNFTNELTYTGFSTTVQDTESL